MKVAVMLCGLLSFTWKVNFTGKDNPASLCPAAVPGCDTADLLHHSWITHFLKSQSQTGF